MRIIRHANEVLYEIETSQGIVESVAEIATQLIMAGRGGDLTRVAQCGRVLKGIYKGDYLEYLLKGMGERAVSYDEAIKGLKQDVARGKIIGVTGKPGVGKTTFLQHLGENIETIDEFWPDGSNGTYKERLKRLEDLRNRGKGGVVAACQVDRSLIDKMYHIWTDPNMRIIHLALRDGSSDDRRRTHCFDAYDALDDYLYGFQGELASLIIDPYKD